MAAVVVESISCFCCFILRSLGRGSAIKRTMFSVTLTVCLTFPLLSFTAATQLTAARIPGPTYSIVDERYSHQNVREINTIVRFKRYASNKTFEEGVVSRQDDSGFGVQNDNQDIISSTTVPDLANEDLSPHQEQDQIHIESGTSTTAAAVNGNMTEGRNKILDNNSGGKNINKGNESQSDSAEFNVTLIEDEEHHNYYTSRVILSTDREADDYWLDESVMYNTHNTLSASYRSAATIQLSFPFLFYGHELKQVTIATGGFLYMSDFLHQWLTATQYIAPLMANFDTNIGNESHIRYYDNGTVFVVWWKDIFLQDYMDAGLFSFQTMLHKDGRIIFSYKQVPDWSAHPAYDWLNQMTVGLSDAFYIDYFFSPCEW